jgi:hypothetical protein
MRNLLLNCEESIRNEYPLRVSRLLWRSQSIPLVGEYEFNDQAFLITAGTSSSLNFSSTSESSFFMELDIEKLCSDGFDFTIQPTSNIRR